MKLPKALLSTVAAFTLLLPAIPAAADSPMPASGGTAPAAIQPQPIRTSQAFNWEVTAEAPDAGFHSQEYKQYPGPIDGLTSSTDTWTGFFRQQARDIFIDLKKTKAITGVSLEFNQNSKAAIQFPAYLEASVSADGKGWNRLGRVTHNVPPSDQTVQNRTFQLTFAPVTTRYVKLHFPVNVWAFARHLAVQEAADPAANPAAKPAVLAHSQPAGPSRIIPGSAGTTPSYLQVPGMNNGLLIYTGAHEDTGIWKMEDFLSMISYTEHGFIKGRMFDTMLFLPYPEVGKTKDAWSGYLGDLFNDETTQLHALDQAVDELYARAHILDKEKVVLTLPYPDPTVTDFGSIDDSGTSLSFSEAAVGKDTALKNRTAAVKWYYDQLMDKWMQAGFKNLTLAGIYWYKESMDPSIAGEKDLVKQVSQMVHDKQLKLFWIPYYGSNGYTQWQDLGFDYVFLQPNFYSTTETPAERMDNLSSAMQTYHLGMELEVDDKMLVNRYYYDLFYTQLNKAHALNMDRLGTKFYYMGSRAWLNAARSSNPLARRVYDDLFNWMNGRYQPQDQMQVQDQGQDQRQD